MNFRSFYNFLEFSDYLELKQFQKALLRQHDVGMTSASQQGPARVKPDVWDPHVSGTGLVSVNDRWGRVKGHVSRVNADGWGHWIS